MYNEFDPKHYKGKWPCTTKTLYNEKTLIDRLHQYFLIYFETFSVPTADTLFLLILSILTLCYNLSSASPPWIFLMLSFYSKWLYKNPDNQEQSGQVRFKIPESLNLWGTCYALRARCSLLQQTCSSCIWSHPRGAFLCNRNITE